MKSMMKPLALTSAIVAAMASAQTMALEAGDMIFRAGLTAVQPQDDSGNVTINGTDLGVALGGAPAAQVEVDNDTQLGLTFEYMLPNRVGIEVLAATPFNHSVSGKGLLDNVDIADVKHLPPTFSLNYHFDTGSAFQPYVGLGVNYTLFFSEDMDADAEAVLVAVGAANSGADIELDDSVGLAAQAGFDYFLDDNWLINASVRYIDIDTEATIKTDAGARLKVDVDIDPYVYSLFLGYKF